MSRGLAAVLALGATLSWSSEGERPIVALTFSGPEADRIAFTRSLGELLRRLDVELTPRQTDAPLPKERVVAEITGDWSSSTEATVTIVDSQQRVVLVRRIARTATPSLVIEAAAHISHSVIEELIAPSPIQPPLVTATVSPPAVVTTPAPAPVEAPSTVGLELSGFFGGRAQAPTMPIAFGGGLRLEVTLATWRLKPGLWLSGEYQAPSEIRALGATPLRAPLTVQSAVLRLGPKVTLYAGDTWRLDSGLAGGADLFFATAHPQGGTDTAVFNATPVVSARVAGHLAVARSADVWVGFTLDFDLFRRNFVTTDRTPLFAPWPVRPSLALGFSFSAAGPDPYVSRAGAEP